MTRERSLKVLLCAGGMLLGLSGCASMAELGDRVLLRPLGQVAQAVGLGGAASGAELCERHASPVNPMAAAPGLGGTGAPSPAQHAQVPGGMGGTGQVAQRPGLGGTGRPDPAVAMEGGLGGTGIVGVVTGFASICVNGVKVEYTPETPVQRDGAAVPLSVLAVGQVVALQATGEGDRLQADRIAVLDAATGPLGAVDAATGRFEVMGQSAVALTRADLAGLQPGDWVRVSGHRLADGQIRASRVQRTDERVARVVGEVTQPQAQSARVGGTLVDLASVAPLAVLQPGQEVSVTGAWTGDRLQATALQAQPTRAALGPARRLLLQGYVHAVQGQQVSVGAESFTLSRVLEVLGGRLEALRVGQPVLVQGRLDEQQRLVVDRLEFRREGGGGRGASSRSASSGDDSSRSGSDDSGGSSSGSSGSGSSGSGSSGSGTSGSGGDSSGQGRGRGRGRGGD